MRTHGLLTVAMTIEGTLSKALIVEGLHFLKLCFHKDLFFKTSLGLF